MKSIFLLASLLCSLAVFAQKKYTVSGYVNDGNSGESVIGANVYIKELMKGTTTNVYGYYSMTIPEGKYTLVIKFIGFQDIEEPIDLTKNIKFTTELQSSSVEMETFTIAGEAADKNVQSTDMGRVDMKVEQIKQLPALLGEVDVLKSIQLLPGIQSAGEGNSGFYVRGGGPDQNLILLDEAVVYNASHVLGFFSVFNADAIKNVEVIKGGMPAHYGGRLSSVLDISMKEGNSKKFQVDGGIGLISSRLTIQGPIKKDTISFIVSGRRTYIDILADPFIADDNPAKGTRLNFYDLNAKINYKINPNNRIFLSGYFGRDNWVFANSDTDFNLTIPWGNATGVLRWNHLFSDKLFSNTSLIFSDYESSVSISLGDAEFKIFSGIRDYNAKMDFTYFPTIRHHVRFGGNYIFHKFTPTNLEARQGDTEFDTGDLTVYYANEAAAYISDEFDLSEKFKISAGVRYSMFQQIGPFERYVKNEVGTIIDTTRYDTADEVTYYGGFEPRAAARFTINSTSSLKGSYSKNYQYIHLTSISASSLPTDFWVPSTEVVQPQVGDQYSLGIFKNLKKNKYETSVEVYYKTMDNLIEYKEGTTPADNLKNNPDDNYTFGSGESYGAEFFLKKVYGKFNGWIGYTLSQTTRTFEEINKGKTYSAKFDRRHDLSIVGIYELSKKITLSATFVYATGNAVSLPNGRYFIEQNIVAQYGDRNSYRMDAYHRLDLACTIKLNKVEKPKMENTLVVGIYNVYNRKNPYFIYFATNGTLANNDLQIQARQVSLFPIIPSVTWNFKF